MPTFLPVLLTTIGAWLVHVGLVTTYMKAFASTHSVAFRIVYTLEISLVMGVAFALYFSKIAQPASLTTVLITVIGFLAVVDALLFGLAKNVRSTFDVGHFIIAYSIVIISLIVTRKIFAS